MLNSEKFSGIYFISYSDFLAQLGENATNEITQQTKNFLSGITLLEIIQGLLIVAIFYGLFWFVEESVNRVSERVNREWRLKIKRIPPFWRFLIVSITTIKLVNVFFDFEERYFLTLAGALIIVVGVAIRDYVSSLIAGLINLFEHSYQVGDRIRIGEYYGEIIEYSLRRVRIQTPEDSIVIIPHNKLWTEIISNSNYGKLEMQVVTRFYFAHNANVDLVTYFLYMAAYTNKYTQLNLPIVVVAEERPWGICFMLKAYPMDARDEFVYKTSLIRSTWRVFIEHNLPRPMIDVDLLKD